MMRWVIGLMSGTSLDGIDAALIETDGERVARTGAALTVPYDDGFRERLRSVLGARNPVRLDEVERELTDRHADIVEAMRRKIDHPVALIGFHGHTILHRPQDRLTRQLGDGARLARVLGLPVIADFRQADVAAGGEGAPFVPAFHRALAQDLPKPLAVLNLGGIGNVTWIGQDADLLAFDTGPGMALIDDWVRRRGGLSYDVDGILSARGTVDAAAIATFLTHGYFQRPPPKSLDRDDFAQLAQRLVPASSDLADGAATLAAITAACVAVAVAKVPEPPLRLLVTGGGRRNLAILDALRQQTGIPVDPVEAVGWDGDALEAQAFGFLAMRSVRGLPLSFPGTTGVPAPQCGGVRFDPS